MRSNVHVIASAALVGATLFLAGCDGSGSAATDQRVADLGDQVRRQAKTLDDVSNQLSDVSRALAGLKQDLATVRNAGAMAVAGEVEAAEGAETDPSAAVGAGEATAALASDAIGEALSSELGEQALAKAIAKAEDKRSRERMDRMVNGMIDRFAADANLSEHQATQMKEISGKYVPQIRDVWRGMRDMMGSSPEDRATYIDEARTRTEELRGDMNSEVKLILTADQFTQYEDSQDRFTGGRGRGGRGGGGRGGDRNR